MKTVIGILGEKGDHVWTVSPDMSVFDALQLMADKNIGAVIVVENDKIVGIMSERDYARKVILKGKASKHTLVRDIMTGNVLYVRPENTTEECMALMSDKRIRHLPVVTNEKLIGIISVGDIVKAIFEEDKFLIKQLQNYITGGQFI